MWSPGGLAVGVNLDATDLGVGAEKLIGVAPLLSALGAGYAVGVGVRPTGDVGLAYQAGVGVHLAEDDVQFGNERGVGVDMAADVGVGFAAPNVGAHLSGALLGGPPMWRSSSSAGATGSTAATLNIPKPSGLAVGDLMVACISLTTGGGGTVGLPSGWTTFQNPVAAIRGQWKIADAADVAATQFTWTVTGATGTVNMSGGIDRITGHNPSNPINVSGAATASAVNPVAPSVTTTVANCLILPMGFQVPAVAVTYTPQSSWTETWDVAGGTVNPVCSFGAYRVVAAIGATGSVTFTSTGIVAATYRTITAAIEPEASYSLAA